MADIVTKLRGWCADWNDSRMVRGEPPRDGIHCDVLYDAADEIERLRAALNDVTYRLEMSWDHRDLAPEGDPEAVDRARKLLCTGGLSYDSK
jgi:hypothetical protein